MDLCDRVGTTRDGPKECMRAIRKRLHHQDPHVVMQAITVSTGSHMLNYEKKKKSPIFICENSCFSFAFFFFFPQLLDACVNNCGKSFRLEVASRDFEHDYKKLLGRSHPKVTEREREWPGLLQHEKNQQHD